MQNIILVTLQRSNKLKFCKTALKWKENPIHERDSENRINVTLCSRTTPAVYSFKGE